jgi:hypothetical protein
MRFQSVIAVFVLDSQWHLASDCHLGLGRNLQ